MKCRFKAIRIQLNANGRETGDHICDSSDEKWMKFVETRNFVTGEYESFKITNVAQPS
jgi:hypothetical protein